MNCPVCKRLVRVSSFKQPKRRNVDSSGAATPSAVLPIPYFQRAICDAGHELVLDNETGQLTSSTGDSGEK